MTYAWIITTDFHPDKSKPMGTNENAAGLIGPRSATDEQVAALKRGEGIPFRMKDDDGELAYMGRFIGDSTSEDAFGPLDDFGEPNYGCTSIEYLRGRTWETL